MRLLVPLIAILIGVVFAIAIARNGADAPPIPPDPVAPPAPSASASTATTAPSADSDIDGDAAAAGNPTDPGAAASPATETDAAGRASSATTSPATTDATTTPPAGDPTATAPLTRSLRAVPAQTPLAPALGSDNPDSPFKFRVAFTSYGAGVRQITLADYAQFVDPSTDEAPPPALHPHQRGLRPARRHGPGVLPLRRPFGGHRWTSRLPEQRPLGRRSRDPDGGPRPGHLPPAHRRRGRSTRRRGRPHLVPRRGQLRP